MKHKTILITTCIAGSLIGLGLLTHYLLKGEKDEPLPEQKPDAAKEPLLPVKKVRKTLAEKKGQTALPIRKMAPYKVMDQPAKTPEKATRKTPPPIADEFPLRLGSKGKRVERLQVWLMRNYGWTGIVTDVFDAKTVTLVKKYLKQSQVDENTFYRLQMDKPVHRQTIIR